MKSRFLPALGLAAIGLMVIGLAALVAFSPQRPLNNQRYLSGAYYYLWYPENFKQGYLREKLVPPQEPMLGLYGFQRPQGG